MSKHVKTYPRGHCPVSQTVTTRHCQYEKYNWPWWLMDEDRELIDEVLDYKERGDDEGPVPARI
jgi:hypothetical protein